MAEVLVDIERMCYGGAGVGRIEGKACFVPFTAPQDRARVRITREKKRYAEGELVELVEPSPLRVVPPCRYFARCGGCNWQHLPYVEQLREKGEIFAETLSRVGGVDRGVILPVLPSPNEFGYRSRIQVKVAVVSGKVRVGFFRTGSHEVVDLPEGCAISAPVLNRVIGELRCFLGRSPDAARIPQVDLSSGDDGQCIAVVHWNGASAEAWARNGDRVREALPSVSGLFVREGGRARLKKVFGVERLSYGISAGLVPGSRALRLSFGRGGFSQVNQAQNLNLMRTVLEWGGFTGKERVLDLYCGNGNLALPLAPLVARVVGIEGYAPSVDDARINARENGIENAEFHAEDAAEGVRRLAAQGARFDVAVLDPPRSGAQGVAGIGDLAPDRIIYVSCDPPTLARDLAVLGESGYRVVRSLPVDMFPQTYHLESVTLLARR